MTDDFITKDLIIKDATVDKDGHLVLFRAMWKGTFQDDYLGTFTTEKAAQEMADRVFDGKGYVVPFVIDEGDIDEDDEE